MLKKVIVSEDFNGNPVEQECYFNLSKLEMMTMEREQHLTMVAASTMEEIEKIKASSENDEVDGEAFMDLMFGIKPLIETLVQKSYGVRKDNQFVKSKTLTEEFLQSPAYDELVWSLMTDGEQFVAFIIGVMPKTAGGAANPMIPLS